MLGIARAWLAVALTLLAVSACSDGRSSGESGPSALPTSRLPAAAQPSTAGGASAPTSPIPAPELSGTDSVAAEAFVRHWFDLLNYAYGTGETASLAAHSAPTCEACESYVTDIQQIAREGGTIDGGEVRLVEVNVPPMTRGEDGIVASVLLQQDELIVRSKDGSVSNRAAAEEPTPYRVGIQVQDGAWRLIEVADA